MKIVNHINCKSLKMSQEKLAVKTAFALQNKKFSRYFVYDSEYVSVVFLQKKQIF